MLGLLAKVFSGHTERFKVFMSVPVVERKPPLLQKNHFKPQDIVFAITLVLIFFSRRVSLGEKNEFQNRVFLFSNFLGTAILNNCDVSWLLYCSDTKSFCLITKGQPFHLTIIQDVGAREL